MWFYNHYIGQKMEKEGGADSGFNPATKKPGKIHPYQAYWTMYLDKVTTKAHALSVAHKVKVDARNEKLCESMLLFSIKAVTQLLNEVSNEVKVAVEEYHNKHKVSDLTGLDVFLNPNVNPSTAKQQKCTKKIQRFIYICTDTNCIYPLFPVQSRAF